MKVDVEERLKEDQTKQSNMHLGYATPRANGNGVGDRWWMFVQLSLLVWKRKTANDCTPYSLCRSQSKAAGGRSNERKQAAAEPPASFVVLSESAPRESLRACLRTRTATQLDSQLRQEQAKLEEAGCRLQHVLK